MVNIVLITEGGNQESQRDMNEIMWNGTYALPDREQVERLSRRGTSAAYKLRILREADECSTPSEVGALLRRERLYLSHLAYWRGQREAGKLEAWGKTRRRKLTKARDPEIAELRRRLDLVEAELEQARRLTAAPPATH
jgi:hypothetical protein